MKYVILAVRDEAVSAFLAPFACRAIPEGSRLFVDLVCDKSTPFAKHPESYSLYCIGEYDDQTGILTAIDPLRMVCTGIEALRSVS